jgi:ABC-2 type transport system ATP-binding protein
MACVNGDPGISHPGNLAVCVRGLRKTYPGGVEAVRGVDLEVRRGEIFGLLGPNGAGKTSTVEILEGHRARSAGEVSVLGYDPGRRQRALRERVGIVLQESSTEQWLTVRETLRLYSAAYPNPRDADEVLAMVELDHKAGARVKTLSGGQQRRLDLALGIAANPELLFLDEPTTGFDPTARRRCWDVIRDLRAGGTTVLLTTHYMEEAQVLADRVAVMAAGKIVALGPPDSLAGRLDARAVVRLRLEPGAPRLDHVELAIEEDGFVSFETDTPTKDLAPLVAWAAERGHELDALSITRPSLEDVYVKLVAQDTQS